MSVISQDSGKKEKGTIIITNIQRESWERKRKVLNKISPKLTKLVSGAARIWPQAGEAPHSISNHCFKQLHRQAVPRCLMKLSAEQRLTTPYNILGTRCRAKISNYTTEA